MCIILGSCKCSVVRELSIVILHLVGQLLVFPSSVLLGSLAVLSMGVCFLRGGVPSSSFSEVFVVSVGRSIGRLMYVALVGAFVGRWLAWWGVGAV